MKKNSPIATYIIFVVCFSVFVLAYLFPGMRAMTFTAKPFPGLIWTWTALSFIFFHSDMTHLIYNLVALLVFGPAVEKRTGTLAFVGFCFGTGILTAIITWLLAPVLPFSSVFIYGFTGCILMMSLLFAAFEPVVRLETFGSFTVSSSVIILIFGAFSFIWILVDSFLGFFHIFHIVGYVSGSLILMLVYKMNVIKVLFPSRR